MTIWNGLTDRLTIESDVHVGGGKPWKSKISSYGGASAKTLHCATTGMARLSHCGIRTKFLANIYSKMFYRLIWNGKWENWTILDFATWKCHFPILDSHEEGNVSLTSPPFHWGGIVSEHALLWRGVTHQGHTFNVPSPLLLQDRGQAGLLGPALVWPKWT